MKIKLQIDLTKKQTEAWDVFFDDETLELGFGGGSRGGKSWFGACLFTFLALAHPNTRYAIGRRTLKTLRTTTLVTIFKFFNKNGIKEGSHYTYNRIDNIIKFYNGSEFLLLDLAYMPSDPMTERFGSLELTCAWVDESGEVSHKIIDILNTRVGNWNNDKFGIKPIVLETFNPSKNHIYFRYWKPYKSETMPVHRKFIKSLVTDNPYIEKRFIDKLSKSNKITVQRLLLGNFDYDDDMRVIMHFDKISDIFTNSFVKKTGEKFMSFDPSGRGKDKTVIMIWDGLVVEKVYTIQDTDQDKLFTFLKKLQEIHMVPNSNTVGDYTGIGTGVIDRLRCLAFHGAASPIQIDEPNNRGEEDPPIIKYLYENLRSQCYFKLSELVGENAIYIDSCDPDVCDLISEELSSIKEKDSASEKRGIIPKQSDREGVETIKSILGRSPDYADAMMMRMIFLFQKKKISGSDLIAFA